MIQRTILRQSRLLSTRALQASRASQLPATARLAAPTQFAPATFAARQLPSAARCYSSEAPKEGEAKASEENKTEDPVEALNKQLKAKDEEIVGLKDKYLRSVAEFRNLQERAKRDQQSARDFAIQSFAKDLIESVDNFDRALSQVTPEKLAAAESNPELKDLASMHEGLKMTEKILMQTLKKHGLERFDPAEESAPFNPNEHEALFMAPMPDKEHNTVFHTQSKGFKLNGRVLRAAKVGVVKNQ